MKNFYKKSFCFVLSLMIALLCSLSAFGVSAAEIYSDNLKFEQGTTQISVPIYIKNNPGIMGYKIKIGYDSSVFTPVSVNQGNALTGGIFDNSIASSKRDSFDVVWSNSSEQKNNGTLFVVNFEVADGTNGVYSFDVSYSSDDTFNEKWQEVKLSCSDATVTIGEVDEQIEEETRSFIEIFIEVIINFFAEIKAFFSTLF